MTPQLARLEHHERILAAVDPRADNVDTLFHEGNCTPMLIGLSSTFYHATLAGMNIFLKREIIIINILGLRFSTVEVRG